MKKYDAKVSLELGEKTKIFFGMEETTDEELIQEIIETMILQEYHNMDMKKIAEEVLVNSNIEYKIKELYKSIKEEVEDYFKGNRTIHEYLIEK